MTTKNKTRVGLLFVHGIGEQKRFEHLTSTARDFAELMRQTFPEARCSVEDKSSTWEIPPGKPTISHDAPVKITLSESDGETVFECHEVWWADLGARTGITDAIGFWIWGLGQWGAPIYRDLDATGLEKTAAIETDGEAGGPREKLGLNKEVSSLVKLPESVAGYPLDEIVARTRLLAAAVATTFIVMSWVLLKRVAGWLMGKAPSPTILVSYVGDVRSYEERAKPGDSALDDPGFPRRVGIRRRMVSEMIAMAMRDYDRWFVVAHSQGTVVAYNGLTEIGHTLPNYIEKDLWNSLARELKVDDACRMRPDNELADMMPARPPWLDYHDVINRKILFRNLAGFLTYGSPLNKFAAIWPRIVATATDRKSDHDNPFGECSWLNLRARQDPVSGNVKEYYEASAALLKKRPTFRNYIPTITNINLPFRPNVLIAHLKYFMPRNGFDQGLAIDQRKAVMRWLRANDGKAAIETAQAIPSAGPTMQAILSPFTYAAALILSLCGAIAISAAARSIIVKAAPSLAPFLPAPGWPPSLLALQSYACWLVGLSLIGIATCGHARWLGESYLNFRTALVDKKAPSFRLKLVNFVQLVSSIGSLAGITWLCWSQAPRQSEPGVFLTLWGACLILAAMIAQSLVNCMILRSVRYRLRPRPDGQ
jgi:hypothetical protein